MSSIRRLARINKIFGSQVYAQVEETHMGLSTVRLADNGARLTNLYTVGHVEATDLVIVEYGTDGTPYIRPTTVPIIEEDEISVYLDPAEEVEDAVPDTPITVCKLTRTSRQTIPADTSTPIVFDKKLFDPCKMWDGSGITIKEDGIYLIHTTMGINGSSQYDITEYQLPSYSTAIVLEKTDATSDLINVQRRKSSGNTLVVSHVMAIWILLHGEKISVWVTNSQVTASQSILVDTGKFPILEAWKVSKLGGLVRSNGVFI